VRPLGAGRLLKLVFLGVLGLKKLSRPTVLIGLSWFLVLLYNAPILKFSQAIFCNFHLEPKLWRHKWRNFQFCKSCRRVMRFSPLDSSDDFMGRGGLLFSLSLIVSELWRHQWRHSHNERCGLHPGREPRSVAASLSIFLPKDIKMGQCLVSLLLKFYVEDRFICFFHSVIHHTCGLHSNRLLPMTFSVFWHVVSFGTTTTM